MVVEILTIKFGSGIFRPPWVDTVEGGGRSDDRPMTTKKETLIKQRQYEFMVAE